MKRQWHKGPPPSIGWWPASVASDPESIRWWDGECWSYPAHPSHSAREAKKFASVKQITYANNLIRWTDRWWL